MNFKSISICLLALSAGLATAQESFYSRPALFSYRPSESKSLHNISRFGPVGIGIDLLQPAYRMRVSNVEPGSPAEGKLEVGQILETINGQPLKDIDPRIQLGQIITKAEATDGIVKFAIEGEPEPVVVKIPVLGSYSETWPLDCPKSDKIVRNLAEYLRTPGTNKGFADIGMLFLLSTGEDKDLEVVKEWARNVKPHTYAWYLGYGGIALCEYYLRTGDEVAFENVQKWADNIVAGQYLDSWPPRGRPPHIGYGNGHLNAAATHNLTVLLLAKECGAEIPDDALLSALRHFYRYAGRGNNPYGDHFPLNGFVDNGKNGLLAFAMAAAASLTPEGEDSLYAKARDVAAMTSFYSTTYMLHGHTGGGIGEVWRSTAMGLLHEKRPHHYREFMDQRKWHYEMSRRFDGSFGILDGKGYDSQNRWGGAWGTPFALTYTIPRKTLRITGAPRTKHSKPFQLPEQPWGTEADNAFLSLEGVPDENGKSPDLSGETLAEDAGLALIRARGDWGDDEIRRYIRHPEQTIRHTAASLVMSQSSRDELMMEFLRSPSPRVRRAMFSVVAGQLQGKALTREIFDLAAQSVADPEESWWVKLAAMSVMANAPADWLVPHTDLLITYLGHRDWWFQRRALEALSPVVADPRTYEKVLPAVGELVRTNQRSAVTVGLMTPMRENIRAAGPEVHQLALETLKESYTAYAGVESAPGGLDISNTRKSHLLAIADSLKDVPGGLDVLYKVAKQRHPDQTLPYREIFLNADPDRMGPELKEAIPPLVMKELIPEYVGKNWKRLQQAAAVEKQSGFPGYEGEVIQDLVALYERAGHDACGWTMFADLRDAEWNYHSFDPIAAEQVPWDQLITRYREVTPPEGMENWYAPSFDPAAAGWKRGKSPFGHYDGKLPTEPVVKCTTATCLGPDCWGATPINTLWEKEVLLMNGTFDLPPLEEGHRYRIRVNDGDHVGAGGGHILYVNGKELIEVEQGNGRGSGGKPKGAFITADFFDDFKGGEITIALKTFLRYNLKYKVRPSEEISRGKMSIHIEKQKIPPMGENLRQQSATVVPMRCAEWQAALDPESDEDNATPNLFRWDGKFTPNVTVTGTWELIGMVDSPDAFAPDKITNARRPAFKTLTLKDDGDTNHSRFLWSGDHLMDVENYQALRVQPRTHDGTNYLLIEQGGFSAKHPTDWTTPWQVMKRKK